METYIFSCYVQIFEQFKSYYVVWKPVRAAGIERIAFPV